MKILFLCLLFVLGACLGSFLCCQARRLHIREEKKTRNKQKLDEPKRSKVTSKDLGARSICLHCGRRLKWYENIPIFSWLILKGKCRECGKNIGAAEILSEIGLGLAWVGLGFGVDCGGSSIDWTVFIGVLIFTLPIWFLALYDGLYGKLPMGYLVVAILCAVIVLVFRGIGLAADDELNAEFFWQTLWAVLILSGPYLLLYLISKGKWVGDGDWWFALAIALALGDAWLALLTLCIMNFLACLYAMPFYRKKPKIYLGPFLVLAFLIVMTFADFWKTML